MIKTSLLVLLFLGGISCNTLPSISTGSMLTNDSETGLDEVEAFLIICKSDQLNTGGNDEPEYFKQARLLAKEGKWGTLQKILSDDRFNFYSVPVIREVVRVSKAPESVALLRTLKRERNSWHIGMINLPTTRDETVKAYVLEIAGDKDPRVRSTCYSVCRENRWPDLLEQARVDSTSTERYGAQSDLSCGLADDAKSYRVELGDLPKDTRIEPARRLKIPERPKGEPLFPEGKP